jgi:hypothetical protein
MKPRFIISILFIAGIIAFTSQGCNKEDTPDTKDFIIKVDSVSHADTINSADAFEVLFYGKIGNNNCFTFKEFAPAFGADFINVTLYGTETIRNDCSGGPVYLDGKVAAFTDMTAGEWTLYVLQPEGITPIESKVYVK